MKLLLSDAISSTAVKNQRWWTRVIKVDLNSLDTILTYNVHIGGRLMMCSWPEQPRCGVSSTAITSLWRHQLHDAQTRWRAPWGLHGRRRRHLGLVPPSSYYLLLTRPHRTCYVRRCGPLLPTE